MEEIYMKKRIITAAVAGILAVSMIAGCAAKSGTANEPNSYTRGAGDAHAQMTSGAVANDSVGFQKVMIMNLLIMNMRNHFRTAEI